MTNKAPNPKSSLVIGPLVIHWSFKLLICMLLSSAAYSQVDVQRFERQLEQLRSTNRLHVNDNVPIDQRTLVDYGAFTTVNYLSLDDPSLHNRTLREYDLTAYGRVNLDGVHEFFFRGRGSYRDFNDGDSFDTEVNGYDGRIERVYYQFDFGRYLSSTSGQQPAGDLVIKVGRDLVYWANGLTMSQDIDGLTVDAVYGNLAAQFIVGRTPSDSVDIDSSRPNFDDHTNRLFYGGMLSMRSGTHRPFVYFLMQRDHNSDDQIVTSVNGSPVTSRFDYNSYYIGAGSTGALSDRLAYGVEGVFEGGDGLSNGLAFDSGGAQIPQTREHIHAWAADVQLNYLLPDPQHTRLSGELILASGDSDRQTSTNTQGGNTTGTRDTAFSAFGLINTGLAFAPSVSNLLAVRGGASFFPFPDIKSVQRLQAGVDLFAFFKLNQHAPIDEATSDERFLGFEPDIYVNWQMNSDVTLALRYGAFVPGDAILEDGKIRQFIYAGVTFAF